MVHVATDFPLPRQAWNEADRHVWIGDVEEQAVSVRGHFSLPEVAYVGSDLNCGCGFRSLSFQNGEWPEEWLIADGGMNTEGTTKNHEELHALLADALQRSGAVELYGCWVGDYGEKTEGEQEASVEKILCEDFFFRERVLYRIIAATDNCMHANPRASCG